MVLGYFNSGRLYGLQIPEMEKVRNMIWLSSNIYDFSAKVEDMVFSVLTIAAVAAVFILGFMAIQWIISKVCGND